MAFDAVADNGETEPSTSPLSAPTAVDPIEPLEDAVLVPFRNADSVVLYFYDGEGTFGSHPHLDGLRPAYVPFRAGDVLHSLADIEKARRLLGYEPSHSLEQGLDESLEWYERTLV